VFPAGLRFIDEKTARDMFHFPPDMAHLDTKVQRLDDQVLVHYFDEEWSEYLIY
jgi:spermidine synthase